MLMGRIECLKEKYFFFVVFLKLSQVDNVYSPLKQKKMSWT